MIILLILALIFIIGVVVFFYVRMGKLTKINEDLEKELDQSSEDLNAKDKTIGDYENTITEKKNKIQEDEEEISKLKTENEEIKQRLSDTIRDTNSTIDSLNIQLETKSNLLIKETKKNQKLEKAILKRDSELEKTIEKYENVISEKDQELEKANKKIHWLSTNQKAPSKEEIIAYDYQQKEVEKRSKKGHHERNMETN